MPIDLLRWTRWATYTYLVAVPGLVESLKLLDMHDTARALQAVLCCMAVAAWALNFDPSQRPLSVTHISLVGLAGTLTGASIWQAQWPLFAATEACLWLGLIALAWVFSKSPLEELTREIPGVMAVAIFAMGVQELMDIGFAWVSSQPLELGAVGRGHPNRRHFNHVQTMALVMGAMTLWTSSARWMRWAAWFGVSVGLALVWFTGARSTLLSLAVVGGGFLILANPSRRAWFWRLLMVCITGFLAYQIFYHLLPTYLGVTVIDAETMGDRNQIGTVNTRIMLWRHAWDMAAQRPWTGWGGLHYATQWQLPAAHPHNIVLQWAAEWGWMSTLLALFALAWWTRRLWVAMWQRLCGVNWPYSPLITTAWLASLAGWIDTMFSGTLTMPASQVWWCFCIGIISSRNILKISHQNSSYHRQLILIIFSTTFLALVIYTHEATSLFSQSETGVNLPAKPRLWLFGFL